MIYLSAVQGWSWEDVILCIMEMRFVEVLEILLCRCDCKNGGVVQESFTFHNEAHLSV